MSDNRRKTFLSHGWGPPLAILALLLAAAALVGVGVVYNDSAIENETVEDEQDDIDSTQDDLAESQGLLARCIAQSRRGSRSEACRRFPAKLEGEAGIGGVPGGDGTIGEPGPRGETGGRGPAGESIAGPQGRPGEGPTAAEIAEAVAAYCAERGDCRGAAGEDGSDGADGAQGEPGPPGPQGPPGEDAPADDPPESAARLVTCTGPELDESLLAGVPRFLPLAQVR